MRTQVSVRVFDYFREIESIIPEFLILALQLLLMRQTIVSLEKISFGVSFYREILVLAPKL